MSEFVVKASQAITIGGTAADVDFSQIGMITPVQGSGNVTRLTKGRFCRVRNTHASQLLYVKYIGTATTSNADLVIGAGQSAIFLLPLGRGKFSMIASGASTTGYAEIGDFD